MSAMSGIEASEPDDAALEYSPDQLPDNVVPLRPRGLPNPSAKSAADVASVSAPTHLDFGTAPVYLPQWPLALVLTGFSVATAVVMLDSFRRGALLMAASLILAFFFRLVLSDRDAGMLRVRSRRVDLVVLGVLAGLMLLFAFWVPAPN